MRVSAKAIKGGLAATLDYRMRDEPCRARTCDPLIKSPTEYRVPSAIAYHSVRHFTHLTRGPFRRVSPNALLVAVMVAVKPATAPVCLVRCDRG